MTEEKWMTFDELPVGLFQIGSLYGIKNITGTHTKYEDMPLGKIREDPAFRPIDPKAIEVGELFLRWVEMMQEEGGWDYVTVSKGRIELGFANKAPTRGPAEAFRDFFERMKPKEPLARDIPSGKFGVRCADGYPCGMYYMTFTGILEYKCPGGSWIQCGEEYSDWGLPVTIYDTLEKAEAAAKEARQ